MAKPNYSFEKRQRELAKKKKKEEKLKEKAVRKTHGDGGPETESPEADPAEAAPPAEGSPAP
ncbi:hypothetical protein [Rhizobacter sp. LjRoot28]|jgi:hypothetical protein|uniref:hypothetical protein n=1 Tax=Rhizobacter sp. LjRoot28 TaxID=3342309 RepID=UPI003ECE24BD